jgi:hypothetical protein
MIELLQQLALLSICVVGLQKEGDIVQARFQPCQINVVPAACWWSERPFTSCGEFCCDIEDGYKELSFEKADTLILKCQDNEMRSYRIDEIRSLKVEACTCNE